MPSFEVVRDSSSNDASSPKLIEIPPPRPKRKPMHPYPRKLVTPVKIRNPTLEQPTRLTSPTFSLSVQETQSPTSVLSTSGSDTLVTTDSTPNGSPSPVSFATGFNPGGCCLSGPNSSQEETGSSSPSQINPTSIPNEQVAMKLELFRQDDYLAKESSTEATSTKGLKLFGKTVLIADSHRPSSPAMQTLPWNSMHTSASHCGVSVAPYFEQVPNENSGLIEAGSIPVQWWNFSAGVPSPFSQLHNPVTLKAYFYSDRKEDQDNETPKEGSWTVSNTRSAKTGENGKKNWDFETQGCQLSSSEEEIMQKLELAFKPSEETVFLVQRTSPGKCAKGFVPYKRCLEDRDTRSLIVTSEERQEQRIRLCL
ncbi:unnamed protein product [Ilex paraguariensis]|uniref:Uncharacterized protein n=1 Tax=Ilex paraguariensis TaxID=185542 RepID=A0ABC8REQ6_9AQUA